MKKKIAKLIKKLKMNKFKDSKLVKVLPVFIVAIFIFVIFLFNYLFNTYSFVMVVEEKGYFLSSDSAPESLRNNNYDKAEDKLKVAEIEQNEYIYKTPLNHYVDNSRSSTINMSYPLFINDGLAIINYNDNTNLVSTDLKRLTGLNNVVFSYGSVYDPVTYVSLDGDKYILLNYENGIYLNLYDLDIKSEAQEVTIPINSFIYFSKDKINYYERGENTFVKNSIDVDFNTTLRFYYASNNEEYIYGYEDFLKVIGISFKTIEEIPEKQIITPEEVIEEVDEEDVTPVPPAIMEEVQKPGFTYVKPSVAVQRFTPNVYSMSSNLIIKDPSGVIIKPPTFTLVSGGKTFARRAFYASGNILISGLYASTEYKIVGQYTYLDEDLKTKKIVTFYSDTLTTLGLEELEPIEIEFENGEIYSNKIELAKMILTSSLDSEVLRGVKNFALTIGDTNYFFSKSDLNKLINGKEINNISTPESLESDKEFDFEITFYDGKNNKLEARNNKGHTRTSRRPPAVVLKVVENEVDYVGISVNLKNDDNIKIGNYHYVVTNSSGVTVLSDTISDERFKLYNLDPNQVFNINVYGDIDLNDGKGERKDYVLGSMEFTSLPITSLGFLNFDFESNELTKDSVTLNYRINSSKTDDRLLKLLKQLHIKLFREDNNELVTEYSLSSQEITRIKNYEELTLLFKNLNSNTSYYIEIDSVVQQGETTYDLDCLHSLKPFTTRKKPAEVVIANSFVSNNMIDLDVKINDPDNSVLTKEVRLELRDLNDTLVDARIIKTNTDFERITYNNLKVNTNYVLKFIADEYNETNSNSTFVSKYVLKSISKYTEESISGKIELTSSLRVANGENLVDMYSETKWIQTINTYTIPKTIDSEGDMHIYSKNGSSSYMYDLSDYHGEIVTATFKIKAINPLSAGHRLFFENYLGNTTSLNYGIELTNISTDKWTTYTYTFRVGSYKSGNNFVNNTSTYYGKYRTDFIGFWFTNGSKFTAEYEVRDFMIYKSRERKEVNLGNASILPGTYNNNGTINVTGSYYDRRARVSEPLILEGNRAYTFDFADSDNDYSAYIYFTDLSNKYKSAYGWFESGRTVYVPSGSKTWLVFRNYSGNANIDPSKVNLKITEYVDLPSKSYETFSYDFVTNTRVNIKDLKDEISNNTYYIQVKDENGEKLYSNEYVELINTDVIKDAIKSVDLEENKKYTICLAISIRDREYVLDSFDISTDNEVKGIANTNDWVYMQPNGNYIVLNDLDFYEFTAQTLGWGYKYFYGTIDFQGYSANVYSLSDRNNYTRLGRIEKSGILKNMVLNVHLNNTIVNTSIRGFVSSNYGTIENVEINVYDERETKFNDTYFNTLVDVNHVSGVIQNFVMKLKTKVNLYSEVGLLTRYNYGTVRNGYVYGENAIISNENSGASARTIGLIQRYGGVKSLVDHIYVINNYEFPSDFAYDITGLIAYETYGTLRNSYTVGNANNINQAVGPVVGYVRATANYSNIHYLSDYIYTTNNQNKITALNLNDVSFQKSVLGDGFNVDEMVKLGYYPQVRYTYNKMPKQEYNELPYYSETSVVDIITMEVVEQTNSTAMVDVVVDNPNGDQIDNVAISDVRTRVVSQNFEDGKTYLKLEVYDPDIYVSKYAIRNITCRSYNGLLSSKAYAAGEKYLYVDFYQEINSVEDWMQINRNLNQNFAIMKDLNFIEYTGYTLGNFSGKIDGNNHVLRNISLYGNVSGLFNQMNGTLQNISFENITKSSDSTYSGLIGYSNQYANFNNVHVKNITIIVPPTRTADTLYVGGLVGYLYYSKVTNSTITDVTITSTPEITDVNAGGMAGYSVAGGYSNVLVQNANISIKNAKSVSGVGGIVGRDTSSISSIANAYSTGTIVSNGYRTGGIIGATSGYVENSYSTVNIQSDIDSVGGIAGYSGTPADIMNNLYLGNMYSKIEGAVFGRIISNNYLEDESNNYAYDNSLINGMKTTEFDEEYENNIYYGVLTPINKGESFISYEELLDVDTYTSGDKLRLGDSFDYSEVSQGTLPKLYYLDSTELLPNQLDTKIKQQMFRVTNLVIDKHVDHANLVLYLDNPDEYLITDIVLDDTNVQISNITNHEGTTIINFTATPKKYYDSYMISEIKYRVDINASEEREFKNIRIPMTFYKNLSTFDDWQAVSTSDAENYVLVNDIDFTGLDFKKGVVFNRLETPSNDEKYTLRGFNYSNNTSGNNKAIINKIVTSLRNINFEDIEIRNTQGSSNNYINLINYNYGSIDNVSFKDIEIYAPSKSRVALIGQGLTNHINNISLDNIKITGKSYVAGLLAYYDNGVNNHISNIEGKNLTIYASNGYAGGIFSTFSTAHGVDAKTKTNIEGSPDLDDSVNLVRNIKVSDSTITMPSGNYAGGIGAYAGANDSVVDNVTVNGNKYVGGAFGYAYESYMYNITVKNSNVSGIDSYIGGLAGQSRYLYDCLVDNTNVKGTSTSTDGVAGFVGYINGYALRRSVVQNSTVVNSGNNTGCLVGSMSGGTLHTMSCHNSTITGQSKTGGMAGNVNTGTISTSKVTNSVIHSAGNYAGGVVGYFYNINDQATYREGVFRNLLVAGVDISSRSYAGGILGGKNTEIYKKNNDYELYFEGVVSTEDNITAGVGAGDDSNKEILNLGHAGFYNRSVINGEEISNNIAPLGNDNLIKHINSGFVNETTGEPGDNLNYPNAGYTDMIKLEQGKNYYFRAENVNNNSGDIFRVRLYDANRKYISNAAWNSNTWYYFSHYTNFGNVDDYSFTVNHDCYVRFVFFYTASASLYEIKTAYNMVPESKLLNSSDIRDKLTWVRYAPGGADLYQKTQLWFDSDYWDTTPLNGGVENLEVPDLSGHGKKGIANVSMMHKDKGFFFDGVDDNIQIPDYTPSSNITVSTTFTSYASRSWQLLFNYGTASTNYFGVFISGKALYVVINGSTYNSGYYVPLYKEVNMTATYDSNKYLKIYADGNLVYTNNNVNKTIGSSVDAKTYVGHDIHYSSTSYKFLGYIKDLAVFNRALSEEEVLANYRSSGITNNSGLTIKQKYTDSSYGNPGYYPIHKWSTPSFQVYNQANVELPTERSTVGYLAASHGSSYSPLYNGALEGNYHIYSSGINTINLELDKISSDLRLSYKIGDKEENDLPVTKRVYSFGYDYNSDIKIVLENTSETKEIVLTKEDLAKSITLKDGKYYHIENSKLYENNKKIVDNIVHVYNDLALVSDGSIYNLKTNEYQEALGDIGLLDREIPLYHTNISDKIVDSYYNYSVLTDLDGNIKYRDGQIIYKDKNVYLYSSNSGIKNDSLIVNNYNNSEYQIVLGDNLQVYSYKTKLNSDNYFMNSNISEISGDFDNDDPIIMIKYDNGGVIAFDYHNGDKLFEYGSKPKISLTKYFGLAVTDNNTAKNNKSYESSNDLIKTLDSVDNQEVIGLLNRNKTDKVINTEKVEDTSEDIPSDVDEQLDAVIESNDVKNDYIIKYDKDTNSYDVYNINDVLNVDADNVVSVDEQIVSNNYLYNYFRSNNKSDEVIKNNRLLIYASIIIVIVLNLVFFAIKGRMKEEKNEK